MFQDGISKQIFRQKPNDIIRYKRSRLFVAKQLTRCGLPLSIFFKSKISQLIKYVNVTFCV